MGVNVNNYVMSPMDVTIGNASRTLVSCSADVSGDLHDTLFSFETISSEGVTSKFYVIFNVDAGTVTNSVANATAIEVGISSDDSALLVASLSATAINAAADVSASATLNELRIENIYLGGAANASDDLVSGTGFTFVVEKQGSKVELGATEGDITFGVEVDAAELTAHQTGTEKLGGFIRAINLTEVSLPLLETSIEKLKEVTSGVTSLYTPTDGEEVMGFGALAGSKQFSSQIENSIRAIFHPTNISEGDTVEDVCIWAGFVNLSEIAHSGENPKKVTVGIMPFIDFTKKNEVKKAVIGKWDQKNFLK